MPLPLWGDWFSTLVFAGRLRFGDSLHSRNGNLRTLSRFFSFAAADASNFGRRALTHSGQGNAPTCQLTSTSTGDRRPVRAWKDKEAAYLKIEAELEKVWCELRRVPHEYLKPERES